MPFYRLTKAELREQLARPGRLCSSPNLDVRVPFDMWKFTFQSEFWRSGLRAKFDYEASAGQPNIQVAACALPLKSHPEL